MHGTFDIVAFRDRLADPDNDGEDRERLLVEAMARVLDGAHAAGWRGDEASAAEVLHGAGFLAAEVNDHCDAALSWHRALQERDERSLVPAMWLLGAAWFGLTTTDARAAAGDMDTAAAALGGFTLGFAFCAVAVILIRLMERRRPPREYPDDAGPDIDRSWGGR